MAEVEKGRSAERGKARARLALRAERALGLESVRFKKTAAKPASAGAKTPVLTTKVQAAPPRPTAPIRAAAPLAPSPRPAAAPRSVPSPAPLLIPVEAEPLFEGPVLPREQKILTLQTLDDSQVKVCTKCVLCETRTQTVFGDGDIDARLMFIGEGPGENEDLEGRPFVGRAGQLLDKMILAMGLSRPQVYICNIVKCRPPNNRQPAPDETAACTPYLLEQIRVIRPHVIVTLGLPSTQYILRTKLSMSKMRGQWQSWRGIKVMPTYHPAYVLRSYTKETREAVWGDLQLVLRELGLPLPKARRE